VRIGAMAANATDSTVNPIDVCVSVAFCSSTAAGFQTGLVMNTEREIRFAEFFVESVLEQRARAIARLFRWLGYEQDRAVPLIFYLRESARSANEGSHVRVVSAGVHHMHILAFV